MEKLFTLLMPIGTITETKKAIKRNGIRNEDIEITREFKVNGVRVKVAIFVAEEDIIDEITEDAGLHRYY